MQIANNQCLNIYQVYMQALIFLVKAKLDSPDLNLIRPFLSSSFHISCHSALRIVLQRSS